MRSAALLDETVAAYERSLELTRNRYARGVASRADVLQAETQLKTTQAQAIDVGVQRAQLEHAIAVLVGQPASTFSLPASPLAGDAARHSRRASRPSSSSDGPTSPPPSAAWRRPTLRSASPWPRTTRPSR